MVALTPLPKDKRRVVDLLDTCERCIGTISERRQSRLAQQQVLYQKPRSAGEEVERERVLAELRERELKARTRFPIDVLLLYFGDQLLLNNLDNSERQDAKFARLSRSHEKPWINYANRCAMLGGLIRTDANLLNLLGEIQQELLEALNTTRVTTIPKLPSNSAVLELSRRIAADTEGRTYREIALDLVDGDDKRANTLLRQERRFRKTLAT